MIEIEFHKYQGTGNDFIMIDDRSKNFSVQDQDLIAHLCHRRFGIGADGLILVRNHVEADFEMIYFNADGCLTSLCGNGSRCSVKFANELGIADRHCRFATVEGILDAKMDADLIYVKMPDVKRIEDHESYFFLHTGSPHHVCFVQNVEKINVFEEGRKIRYGAPYFDEGSNVNFVERTGDSEIHVRTYERGVENETLSCGTGVIASALVQALKGAVSPVKVKTPGGELSIRFERTGDRFENVFLCGPAEKVFSGKYYYDA